MCTGQRRMFYYLRSQVSKCVLKVLRENLSETFLIQAKTINLRSWPQPGRNQCTALFKTLFKNYCNIIIIAFVEIFIFNMFVVCSLFYFGVFGVGVCVLLWILKKCFFRKYNKNFGAHSITIIFRKCINRKICSVFTFYLTKILVFKSVA